jgi:hypothetical protein
MRVADSLDEDVAQDNKASVKVDIKKLIAVLGFYNVSTDCAICCKPHRCVRLCSTQLCSTGIVENFVLILHVLLAPSGVGSVTYYVPVLSSDLDELLAPEDDN